MRTLMSDVRHALRVFVITPSYALAVTAVLALGIGGTTAIFSIVNAVLLRSLPFEQPDRMVRLFHIPPQSTFPGMTRFSLSPANFLDWQRDSGSFEAMAAYSGRSLTLTSGSKPEAILIGTVGPDFFKVVRMQPALGRTFLGEEYAAERSRVVVVSDAFWQSHLGGTKDAIGRVQSQDVSRAHAIGRLVAQAMPGSRRKHRRRCGDTDADPLLCRIGMRHGNPNGRVLEAIPEGMLHEKPDPTGQHVLVPEYADIRDVPIDCDRGRCGALGDRREDRFQAGDRRIG